MTISKRIAAGVGIVALLAAGLTFAGSRPGHAQPRLSRLEQVSAVGAAVKHAMGPRVRYLSAAWQNVIGLSNRFDQLRALGLKPGLVEMAGPAASAPAPTGRFGPVSSPPTSALAQTRFTGFTTSETSTAWCGSNAVVGINDSGSLFETPPTSPDQSLVGYSQSTNAGASFTDLFTPTALSPTGLELATLLLGDPVVKCTSQSDFFISSLYETCTQFDITGTICTDGNNGVTVSASIDGGNSFGTPVRAVSEDFTQHLIDKDWMTVDPKHPKNIYVTYTDFDMTQGGCTAPDAMTSINLVKSTDGGKTFSVPVTVAATGVCDDVLQGSQVVVAPDGSTVYVAYEKIAAANFATREIEVAKSIDGGMTFGQTPAVVASVGCAGDCFELQGLIRSNEFPSLTINGKGRLFMAWNSGDFMVPDAVTGFYDFTNIRFSKSSDGITWSSPVVVNTNLAGSKRDHFEPTIAFSGGRIAVCFYDRRNDPLNFLIDRYCANSTDGGATWTNTRITAASFPSVVNQDVLLASEYMGDYDAMARDALGINAGFLDSFATNAPGYPRVRANTF